MTSRSPLRFGLVGTGYWARVTHAPALASTGGIELAAVCAFSVPPDVQQELAVRAARAGKHLLLEKPIAPSVAAADGGPWLGGTLTWLGTAMDESSPFNTPWHRRAPVMRRKPAQCV